MLYLRLAIGGIFFMHGNRDFMVGSEFLAQANMRLLNDPYKIEIASKNILLSHGDIYCSFDKKYQLYRKIVHNKIGQKLFCSCHLNLESIAKELRKPDKSNKEYLDNLNYAVDDNMIRKDLEAYS